MKVFELAGREAEPVDPANFTGGGTLVRMPGVCDTPAVNAYRVSLDAGTRMRWHTHTGPQLLLVTEGTCRFQKEGEPVRNVHAGGIISVEAGELHWHAATPDARMTHIALNIDAKTTWLERVTDAQYEGRG
jgi:quercetin dioxygenase-like cupin family protein